MTHRVPTCAVCLLAASCSSDAPPNAPAECAPRDVLVVLSDYASTFVGAAGPTEVDVRAAAEFGADPVLRMTNERAFLLNRNDGVLFSLQPACGFARERLVIAPPQRADNPQDVACTSDGTLWIPNFNVPVLRVLPAGSAYDGAGVVELPLAEYDDDGNPNAASAVSLTVGGREKVFVSLQRLDDTDFMLPPKAPSLLVRFDAEQKVAEQVFELAAWNPFGTLHVAGELMFLAAPRNFDSADDDAAGIEVYDPARNLSRIWLTEQELGGSVTEIAVHEGCGAAIVAGPQRNVNPTELLIFRAPRTAAELDAASGRVLARGVLGPTAGYDLQGLAWRGSKLYVGDRRRRGASYPLHMFDQIDAECTLTSAGTLPMPQKPVGLSPTLREIP